MHCISFSFLSLIIFLRKSYIHILFYNWYLSRWKLIYIDTGTVSDAARHVIAYPAMQRQEKASELGWYCCSSVQWSTNRPFNESIVKDSYWKLWHLCLDKTKYRDSTKLVEMSEFAKVDEWFDMSNSSLSGFIYIKISIISTYLFDLNSYREYYVLHSNESATYYSFGNTYE